MLEPLPEVPDDQPSMIEALEIRRLIIETAKRRAEALQIYQALNLQQAFHASKARIRLARGSNRAGKTLVAAVEVARAVTGKDPYGKFPTHDGRAFCVGKNLDHCGEVLWRKLGKAGAYRMIRDLATREWRPFRPWDPQDAARKKESKPAPPLIPRRFIRAIAWENKAKSIPKKVTLINGWELNFYSSEGKPPQGSDLDLFWFDEEITDPDWFPEMSARILDRHGCGIWSATPQAGTDRLFELHEQAEVEMGQEDAAVEEFQLLLADNPYVPEADKRAFAASLSEEDRRVRIFGEFSLTGFKVYPEFSTILHGIDQHFQVPANWSRVVVVDPGYRVCAVLFAAVPPTNDSVVLYDELYLHDCDAAKFAEAMAQKQQNQIFESFLIDQFMAMHSEAGSGKTVAQQYSEALRLRGVGCVRTGPNFVLTNEGGIGAKNRVEAGIIAVHGWLRVGPSGKPRLLVVKGKLPNFEFEIKRYHNRRVQGRIIDKPDDRKHNHLMDCLRYLVMFDPKWVKPNPKKAPKTGAVRAWHAKRDRQVKAAGGSYVNLGPGRGHKHGW